MFAIGQSAVRIFQRFEICIDDNNMYCINICGPVRRKRTWQRSGIVGVQLRRADSGVKNEPQSTLVLALSDGRSERLIPPLPTPTLKQVETNINRLFDQNTPGSKEDRLPLGGGLSVSQTAETLQIWADTISPGMVPGGLYSVANYFAFVHPLFSLGVTAVLWMTDALGKAPISYWFWFTMLGQMIFFVVVGHGVRRWIGGIASRTYDITIDPETIAVTQTDAKKTKTQQRKIADVRDVRRDVIVSSNNSSQGYRPLLMRVLLCTESGPSIELLCGRPEEETTWLVDHMRQIFNLPADPAWPATIVWKKTLRRSQHNAESVG